MEALRQWEEYYPPKLVYSGTNALNDGCIPEYALIIALLMEGIKGALYMIERRNEYLYALEVETHSDEIRKETQEELDFLNAQNKKRPFEDSIVLFARYIRALQMDLLKFFSVTKTVRYEEWQPQKSRKKQPKRKSPEMNYSQFNQENQPSVYTELH